MTGIAATIAALAAITPDTRISGWDLRRDRSGGVVWTHDEPLLRSIDQSLVVVARTWSGEWVVAAHVPMIGVVRGVASSARAGRAMAEGMMG